MKVKKDKLKKIPFFNSENEEAKFWDSVDSTDYFSGRKTIHFKMPTRTTVISLRLPKKLLARLKKLAELKDVPYQSLLKMYLDQKIMEEIASLKRVA